MRKATGQSRVLHVVHSLQCGGAEVLVRDLIAQRGQDTHFEVLSLSGDGPLAADIEALGGIVHCYKRTPGFDRGCCKAIAQIVKRNAIDIIHAHQYSPWVYAALARLHGAWRAKVLYTEHGRTYPDFRKSKRVIANRLALLPLTHRITVVSDFIGGALQRHEAIPGRRIELIYNGIDPAPCLMGRATTERPYADRWASVMTR
jgi:glycosyltransferase involved in cell wall biosynthesis